MRFLQPGDSARSFADVLDALPIIAFIAFPDGTVAFVSDTFDRVTGIPTAEALGRQYLSYVYPEDVAAATTAWERAFSTGAPYRAEYRFRFADGSYHWILAQAEPVRDEHDAIISWFGTNTIIDNRKRAELGLRLLSSTGAAAVRSLDYRETLRNLVNALVEEFASYCIIDIEDGALARERFAAHRDPARVARLVALTQPTDKHPITRAISDGEARAIPIDETWLVDVNAADDRVSLIRDFRIRSVVIVPVRAPDGHIIGALTAGLDYCERTGRVYDDADVPYVEEVAHRAGAAITNARLFEQQRRIAVELQATSLPRSLPRVRGLALDAYYRPGSDEATIGGDWYDAFALDDGRVVFTVGDVRGHGLEAAIVMTKLRQAIQAAAMVDPNPTVMLSVADRTMRLADPDAFATALAAAYDPATRELIVASAGHPSPILVEGDLVDEVVARGPVLGLGDTADYVLGRRRLAPDARLVLYTDGITEANRDLDLGYARLIGAIRAVPRNHASPAAAIVQGALGDAGATDDVAVLVATITSTERS